MKDNSEEVLNDNIVINNGDEAPHTNFDKKFGNIKRKIHKQHRPKLRHNGPTRIPKRIPNK